MRTTLRVAAAALIDARSRVLVAQRPAGKSFAGQWEFPGGKLEPGESPEAALVRELAEELSITVAAADLAPLVTIRHPYPDFDLEMIVFTATHWTGTPRGAEGQAIRWATVATLAGLDMPPADVPIVKALQTHVAAA